MNIKDVKTAFKIANVVLDNEHAKNRIKFEYLSEIRDENGDVLSKNVLTDETGRVYLIVVDNKIMKIGGSQCKGGIKATLSFYQGAMQGRPSIRTYGIHLLLRDALDKGCKIEIYMIVSKNVNAPVKGLFSETTVKVNAFKEMENKCKEEYKRVEKDLPEWNFQERGAQWPVHIQRKHAEYIRTTVKEE